MTLITASGLPGPDTPPSDLINVAPRELKESLEEGIEKANAVPYGLAAYGFTNRADYVDRMVEGIEAGNVSINTLEASLPETPFGGVKSSGYGREGGTEGLHNYMIVKNISHSFTIV